MKRIVALSLLITASSLFGRSTELFVDEGTVEIQYLDTCNNKACCHVKRARALLKEAEKQLGFASQARGVGEIYDMVKQAYGLSEHHVKTTCDATSTPYRG